MTLVPKEKSGTPNIPRLPYSGKRPFYGWIIVFVGFITQIAQGLVNQGFSTYPDLFHNEFGWSKAVLAGPRSVTSVQNSVLGPITGFLVDRFGPRIVVGGGVVVTGLWLILLGTTHSLWTYYFSNIIMALGLSLEGLLRSHSSLRPGSQYACNINRKLFKANGMLSSMSRSGNCLDKQWRSGSSELSKPSA